MVGFYRIFAVVRSRYPLPNKERSLVFKFCCKTQYIGSGLLALLTGKLFCEVVAVILYLVNASISNDIWTKYFSGWTKYFSGCMVVHGFWK